MRAPSRRRAGVLFLLYFLGAVGTHAGETILVRKRPLLLEEGVVLVRESRDVEAAGERYDYGLRLDLLRVTRDVDRAPDGVEEPAGTIRLALRAGAEAYQAFRAELDRKLRGLDPSSFRSTWAGLGNSEFWSSALGKQDFMLLYCLDAGSSPAQAITMFARSEKADVAGFDAGTSRTGGMSTHDAERSREYCAPLLLAFDGEPVDELRTFPAALVERVERLTVTLVDESGVETPATLPDHSRLELQEDPQDMPYMSHMQSDAKSVPDPAGLSGEVQAVQTTTTDRVRRAGRGEGRVRITAKATDTEIDPQTLGESRLLGFRVHHDATVVRGGVMPPPPERTVEVSRPVLVGIFPTERIAPAVQEAFLRAVAEQVDGDHEAISPSVLLRDVAKSIDVLDLRRPFLVLCSEDAEGRWEATYHLDEASAKVLNPDPVCRELDRRLL